MSQTDIRLLIDEAVTDPLARAILRIPALKAVYARDIPEIAGQDDDKIIAYANRQRRVVFTTERKFREFPVCKHPGIIILTTRERHEAIRQRIFTKFIHSGYRQLTNNNLTRLSTNHAEIEDHSGEAKIYRF